MIEPTAHPRLLLVSSTLEDDGGVPVCVGQLAEALARLGVALDIVGQHRSPVARVIADVAAVGGAGVHAERAPWHPLGQWRVARRVRRLVLDRAQLARREGRPLVVHLHGVWVAPVIAAAGAALECGARLVVSPHGMLRHEALRRSRVKKAIVWNGWLRRRLRAADALHVTSPQEGDDLRDLLPGCRPRLVPLGVVPPADAPRRPVGAAPRRAGYLGRIVPIKNLDTLLTAWARLSPPGWTLSLAGPGGADTIASLRGLADRLGIGSSVEIGGRVPIERLGEHFASLDLFILPSRSEAFALVVGEALASGVPAVVTTAAPWEDVVARGCGWSVAPTVEGLVEAIAAATALAPEDLAAMGRRGGEWIRRDYSWESVARRHLAELYHGDASAGPVGRSGPSRLLSP